MYSACRCLLVCLPIHSIRYLWLQSGEFICAGINCWQILLKLVSILYSSAEREFKIKIKGKRTTFHHSSCPNFNDQSFLALATKVKSVCVQLKLHIQVNIESHITWWCVQSVVLFIRVDKLRNNKFHIHKDNPCASNIFIHVHTYLAELFIPRMYPAYRIYVYVMHVETGSFVFKMEHQTKVLSSTVIT